jgi:hypothetical protein
MHEVSAPQLTDPLGQARYGAFEAAPERILVDLELHADRRERQAVPLWSAARS